MITRKKPKRLYFSVREDVHKKFKKWCEKNDTTIQEQLENMFQVWVETEVEGVEL